MRISDWSSDVCSSDLHDAILELMRAVDDYIPTPERPKDLPFLMPIEDVFSISGRGTVVTGRVERGVVKVGEEVEIVGLRATPRTQIGRASCRERVCQYV